MSYIETYVTSIISVFRKFKLLNVFYVDLQVKLAGYILKDAYSIPIKGKEHGKEENLWTDRVC